MRKTLQVEIDGYKYEISKLRTREQYKIFTKLIKLVSPALKSVGAGKSLLNVDTSEFKDALNIGAMIEALTERFDEDESYDMMTTLLSKVVHYDSTVYDEEEGGEKIIKGVGSLITDSVNKIDVHFDDDMFRMLKLTGKCIQHNYGGFIKKLGNSMKEDKEIQAPVQANQE